MLTKVLPLTSKGREESPESVTAGAAMPPIAWLLAFCWEDEDEDEDDDAVEPPFILPLPFEEEEEEEAPDEAGLFGVVVPAAPFAVAGLVAFAWDPLLLSCPDWFWP